MNKKEKKQIFVKVITILIIFFSLAVIILWQIFLSSKTSYYLIAAIVLVISMLPFLLSIESEKVKSRELALLGILIAIAVVSRAVFYFIPQFKPIGAVVICTGASLGARRGYLVGAFSAFISNFIFGQGMWTPFQMVALGLVGFIAGILFKRFKYNRISLTIIGFILTFVLYSLIVDLSSVLVICTEFNFASILAIYVAGIPFNAIFGIATAIFLFLFGKSFIQKMDRVIIKYSIV